MWQKRVKQVGALPWRERRGRLEILLVTSGETGRWVIPKGGIMDHLVDMNAARQEALEEAGIAGRMARQSLGAYTYAKSAPGHLPVQHTVKVFALEVQRELKDWPERRQRKRRWFNIEEAAEKVTEPGLRKIIRACQRSQIGFLSFY